MRTVGFTFLLTALLLLGLTPLAHAIEIAVPSDFYTWSFTGDPAQVQPGVTVFTGWQESQDGNASLRGYAYGLDEAGELVFFKQGDRNVGISYWNSNNADGKHTHGRGHIAHSQGVEILNSDLSLFHEVSPVHPEDPDNYEMTSFEAVYDDQGTVWTLWFHYAEQDLSDLGGYENAIVEGQVIERRDLDGNLIWSWSSHDHMTGVGNDLDYTFMDNDDAYLEPQFRPLHINGYQITESGDIVVSARFMSLVFKIDYDTGDIEWRIGGGGETDGNQFTYVGDADGHPLSFNRQHDPQFDETNLTLSVFDNGQGHDTPRSYAKEYQLDFDNMTAELVWYYVHPDEVFDSAITGSVRKLDNGNRLIGWGALDPPVHATELNANNEVVWQVHFSDDPLFGIPCRQVRAIKTQTLEPAATPYACYVLHEDTQEFEIVANWFGHEDEIDGYEVYYGAEPDPQTMVGTTDNGIEFVDIGGEEIYYAKVRPVDSNGDPVGDFSEVIELNRNSLNVEEGDVLAATALPSTISLSKAWPNPFNGSVSLNLNLPQPSEVQVQVFDVLGRQVADLQNGRMNAGSHALTFDASGLASGVYFIRANAPGQTAATRKVTLVR